jgi:glycine oxidase
MPRSAITSRNPDIAVIGGGIVGLWTAYEALRQGLSVTLLEKRRIGAGASGGVLGALMPHQPTGWNAKKQFQLDGLLSLEEKIAELEALTGIATGYRRCGRLMPIRTPEKRRQSRQWADASEVHWPPEQAWRVIDGTPLASTLPQDRMPHGANFDTLSAHISPRKLISALTGALRADAVTVREGAEVASVSGESVVTFADGEALRPARIVVCAGWDGFALLEPFFDGETGRGVKGQAATLRPARPIDPAQPILFDGGTYVIAHEDGLVAVGSTSENEYDDPAATDDKLDALIDTAKALCPSLAGAEVMERWAGVRPRAAGRDPLVGPINGTSRIFVATGGFKISFGIAHLMAKAVVMQAKGEAPQFLPESFLPENRLTPRRG